MVKVKINFNRLERAAVEAFQETCYLAHREMIQVISEPGAFPEFPNQDIVDTGVLRASQQPPEFSADGTEAIHRNTADYSLYLALGYVLRNGREQPGRNWMMLALTRMDLQATYNKLLERKLK